MILGFGVSMRLSPRCDGLGLRFNDTRCELPRDTGASCLCAGVGVANAGGRSFGCGVAAVALGVETSMPMLPAKPTLFEGEAASGVCVACSFPSRCDESRCLDGEVPTPTKPHPVVSPLLLLLPLLLQ